MTTLLTGWTPAAPSPPLAEGALHVWAVPLSGDDAAVAHWSSCLSADERERAARFHRPEWRDRYAIGRGALRHILAGYLGCGAADVAFDYGAHGKPRLAGRTADAMMNGGADGPLEFNLAHSGELALVAVTRGCAVGIDLERHRAVRRWRQLAGRYFHAQEIEELDQLTADASIPDPDPLAPEPFFRCWTRKEAVVKSIGSGVQYSLEKFRVPIASEAPVWVELEEGGPAWLQHIVVCPGYSAAVATLGADRRCERFEL